MKQQLNDGKPQAEIVSSRRERLEKEIRRVDTNSRFRQLLRSSLGILIVVAACAILVAALLMPVMRIYGNSMGPNLSEGEIVASIKGKHVKAGDMVCVYYGNKVLVKRVIALSGQWVDMDEDGTVYVYDDVKGAPLEEPYLTEGAKALGEINISLPYQVPPNAVFIMGDNRATSIDSRNTSVGCIDTGNIIGRIVFRFWPLDKFGVIRQP